MIGEMESTNPNLATRAFIPAVESPSCSFRSPHDYNLVSRAPRSGAESIEVLAEGFARMRVFFRARVSRRPHCCM
jgi:hypothetical protein